MVRQCQFGPIKHMILTLIMFNEWIQDAKSVFSWVAVSLQHANLQTLDFRSFYSKKRKSLTRVARQVIYWLHTALTDNDLKTKNLLPQQKKSALKFRCCWISNFDSAPFKPTHSEINTKVWFLYLKEIIGFNASLKNFPLEIETQFSFVYCSC